jgi:hypothetical protein
MAGPPQTGAHSVQEAVWLEIQKVLTDATNQANNLKARLITLDGREDVSREAQELIDVLKRTLRELRVLANRVA